MLDKKYIFSGISYKNKKPSLVLDSIGTNINTRDFFFVIQKQFTITRFKSKYCIGRYNLSDFESFPCPSTKQLEQNTICHDCFVYNGFNPAFYNASNSELSDKQRTYNFEPHLVYLAYFSDDFIKVGITHHQRQYDRWLEQGARFAVVILRCENAYEARDYEVKISALLKLPEVIRTDVKLSLLYQKIDAKSVNIKLCEIINKIESQLSISCLEKDIHYLDSIYNPLNISINKDIIDISNLKPLIISGKAIALFGSILVLENNGLQHMVSLKKLVSHKINLSSGIESIDFEPKQVRLF